MPPSVNYKDSKKTFKFIASLTQAQVMSLKTIMVPHSVRRVPSPRLDYAESLQLCNIYFLHISFAGLFVYIDLSFKNHFVDTRPVFLIYSVNLLTESGVHMRYVKYFE